MRRVPVVFLFLLLNNMLLRLLILLFLCTVSLCDAQVDSLIWMKAVDIQGTRFDFSESSLKVQQLDTSKIAKLTGYTLSDRLDREAPLFMKSYGPGSLSTVSLRGGSAAHTAVLWNGLSLNSPMLGIYDFSLLPVFLLDEVRIQSGGNGPLVGNGAVSGTIFLNSKPVFNKKAAAEVLIGCGSFGQQQYGTAVTLSNRLLVSRTKIYTQKAENNFQYTNVEGTQITQSHSRFNQTGFTEDLSIGSDSNRLDSHFWYLENEREIPPHMLALSSEQEQKDKSLRAIAEWSVIKKQWFWKMNSGFNKEYIRYQDPAARLDEISEAFSVQASGILGYQFSKKFRLLSHVEALQAKAKSESYTGEQTQLQYSVGLKGEYESEKLFLNGSVRQSWFESRPVPFLPAITMRYYVVPCLSLRADAAKVYRVPTLNDRYWVPGGNIDLEPEEGFSSSVGIQWAYVKGQFIFSTEAALFYSLLKKAIVWLPESNGVYTAKNINETESKGLEWNLNAAFSTDKWRFSGKLSMSDIHSMITATEPVYADAIGKQMMYIPRFVYKSEIVVAYHHFSLSYYHNYTGYRYTSIDHVHYLDPFTCAEIQLAWSKKFSIGSLTASLGIKNIYNEEYQVIAWRAMPGRSLLGGLLFTFGK